MNLSIKNILFVMLMAWFSDVLVAIDYQAEATAALQDNGWYDKKHIPTAQQVEGFDFFLADLETIKIRLPIDLKRIIDEHRLQKKPISLAVACGDRELPWRTEMARKNNDPARPNVDDFLYGNPEADELNIDLHRENYVSIDPHLGISKGSVSREGAGHIIMDAMKIEHWKQLFDFLEAQGVTISKIFVTAMLDVQNIIKTDDPNHLIFQRMPKGSQLVGTYFYSYSPSDKTSFEGSKQLFVEADSTGKVWLKGPLASLFVRNDERFSGGLLLTDQSLFFSLWQKHNRGDNIDTEIDSLIDKQFEGLPENRNLKLNIRNMAKYYVSIFDGEKLFQQREAKRQSLPVFKESVADQKKTYLHHFLTFLKSEGNNVEFLSSPFVAKELAPSVVKAQDFKPGDYPFGERNFIPIVVTK